MSMDSDKDDDALLDDLFASAKAERPKPDEAFLERLNADAVAAAPHFAAKPAAPTARPFMVRLKGVFAASGLSGAAALGVWIGFAMPELLTTYSPVTEDVSGISAFLAGADLSVLSE